MFIQVHLCTPSSTNLSSNQCLVSSPEVTVHAYLVCAAFTPFKIQLQCYAVKSSYDEFKHSAKMYYINLNFIITDTCQQMVAEYTSQKYLYLPDTLTFR